MQRKLSCLIAGLVLLCIGASPPLEDPGIPEWVMEDWNFQMSHTGIWIADNTAYQGEEEPFDAFGMQWEWGIGQRSLKGRLFCLQAEKEVATVWEFLQYWDFETKALRMIQIGGDGTLGQGTVENQGGGKTKSRERFCTPAGPCFEVGHETWKKDEDFYTQSFDIVDGQWSKRRLYVWKQKR